MEMGCLRYHPRDYRPWNGNASERDSTLNVTENTLLRIWHDKSYSLEDLSGSRYEEGKAKIKTESYFLRFDEARGSQPSRMTYLQVPLHRTDMRAKNICT